MQKAFSTLDALRGLGLEFSWCAGQPAVRPRTKINSEMRFAIQAHRDIILRCIEAESSAGCEHEVLERAAILELDGGHRRANADRLALPEFGLASWDKILAPSAERADP